MDTNKKIVEEIENYKTQINELKAKLNELENKKELAIEEIKPVISKLPEVEEVEAIKVKDFDYIGNDYYNTIQIPDDKGIICLSLSFSHLINLVAGERGGHIYQLKKFGDRVIVPNKDLIEVIRYHKNLFEAGFYAILSDEFLKKHDLVEIASKNLTKEKIESIVNNVLPIQDIIALFKSCPQEQRNTLIWAVVNRQIENPNTYDVYTISKLTRELGINFEELIEKQIAYNEMLEDVKF